MQARQLSRGDLKELLSNVVSCNSTQQLKDACYKKVATFYNDTFTEPHRYHDDLGFTLLHWATLCNQIQVMDILINHKKVDVNSRSIKLECVEKSNITPLYLAVAYGSPEAAKLLLDHNANLYIRPEITVYSDNGVDVGCTNFCGTAVDAAILRKNSEILKLLELPKLTKYIQKRTEDLKTYQSDFSIFGHTFNFGYSKQEKIDAANELKTLLQEGKDDIQLLENVSKLHPALKTGKLGEIYHSTLKNRR